MDSSHFQGFPRILCVFYAEFDLDLGPKLRFEIPQGFFSQTLATKDKSTKPDFTPRNDSSNQPSSMDDTARSSPQSNRALPSAGQEASALGSIIQTADLTHAPVQIPARFGAGIKLTLFDLVSTFLIPHAELNRKLIVYYTEHYQIMGFPVVIKGEKYTRNELSFNCGLVFERDAQTTCFEPIIKKIAQLLELMEHGIEFLRRPEKKSCLGPILSQLYMDLNQYNESRIVYQPWFDFNLKLFPPLKDPPTIEDYDVPVLTSDLGRVVDDMWDMTLVRVLEHINGVSHVKKIAELCDIDLALVRSCLQQLYYYECIEVVDVFKFSNIYALRPDVVRTIQKTVNPDEFVAYVTYPETKPATFQDIIRFYFNLKPGLTVSRWMEKTNIVSFNVDVRRFIIFGMVKGLIYRIHKYPISMQPASCFPNNVSKFFSGQYHLDAICTQLNMSEEDMEEYCAMDPKLRIIFK
ncbi:Nitrogen permease regulator 2 [Dispira simplex]|nr:Nitrogen permease regulator 2 [Dispira simplex]